jgi:predicted phosphoribosyltransferase
VLPGGAVVGRVVADAFGCKVVALRVDRSTSVPSVEIVGAQASELADRKVVIVDDGVESGTSARAVIGYLRGLSLDALVFAVPICHAQAAADLAGGVDTLVAPRRPFTPRALRWEYTTFAPPADDASALQIVQPLGL